jgi:hypothetical protein
METSKKDFEKSAYHRPEVRDYGNLREITKASKNTGLVTDAKATKSA